jgi:AraC-like DNA-binding protein
MAIELIRENYKKPIHMPGLARQLGMSISAFHHHFKAIAAMSPLQFQRQLRLQEARRLLLTGDADASTAGYRVGYDDRSHFSRVYKKAFGEPPMRDVERLQGAPTARKQGNQRRLLPATKGTGRRQSAARSRRNRTAAP